MGFCYVFWKAGDFFAREYSSSKIDFFAARSSLLLSSALDFVFLLIIRNYEKSRLKKFFDILFLHFISSFIFKSVVAVDSFFDFFISRFFGSFLRSKEELSYNNYVLRSRFLSRMFIFAVAVLLVLLFVFSADSSLLRFVAVFLFFASSLFFIERMV